jgi:hypothetical protein
VRLAPLRLRRDRDQAPAVGANVRLFLPDPRDGLMLDAIVEPAPEVECERASGLLTSVAARRQ